MIPLLDSIRAEQARLIEGIQALLVTLGETAFFDTDDFVHCQSILTKVSRHYPPYLTVNVVDDRHQIRCSTTPSAIGTDVSDRPHLQRALQTGMFSIDSYGPDSLGESALGFAMPVYDAENGHKGALTALLDLGWLSRYLERKPLSPGMSVLVTDRNGVLIARSPPLPAQTGQPLPDRFRPFLTGKADATAVLPDLDGVERIFAWSPPGSNALHGLMIAIGVDRDVVTGPIKQSLLRTLSVGAAALLVGLIGTWLGARRYIRQPVAALAAAAARWRTGDFTARAVVDQGSELAEIARVFNAMAEAQPMLLAKMNALLLNAPLGIGFFDRRHQIIAVNRRLAESTGRPAEDLAGSRLVDVIPAFAAEAEAILAQVFLSGVAEANRELAGEIPADPGTRHHWLTAWFPVKVGTEIVSVGTVVTDITGMRQAEERLRLREARARAITEHAAIGVVTVAPDGALLSVNPAYAALLGYDPAELTGRRSWEFAHPDDRPASQDRFGRLLKGEIDRYVLEKRYLRQDGAVVFCRFTASLVRGDDGRPRFAIAVVEDVTQRAETDRRLRESRALLDTILGAIPDPIFVKDSGGRCLMANTAAAAMVDCPRDQLIGRSDHALFGAKVAQAMALREQRILATGEPETWEENIFSAVHGQPRFALITMVPLRDAAGTTIGTVAISRDITERIQVERTLTAERSLFEVVLKQMPAGLSVIDAASGRTILFNQETVRLLGHEPPPGGDLGRYAGFGGLHPDGAPYRPEAYPSMRSLTTGATIHQEEMIYRRGDGRITTLSVNSAPVRNAEGRITLAVTTFVDISERKAMEAALRTAKERAEEANRAKSRFLAAASHDLRQPLQSLMLFGRLLGKHITEEPGRQVLAVIEQSLDSLKELLDSLLDISRLDTGQVVPQIEEFPLTEVVDAIATEYHPVAAAKNLALLADTCPIIVRSDRTLLRRILRNLVENALRYTEQGALQIRCRPDDGAYWIEVEDSGIGIAASDLERIFEEFQRVEGTERGSAQGLGLGLAIVRRLAQLLGHEIAVRSEPGRGSTFGIRLTGVAPESGLLCLPAPETGDDPFEASPAGCGRLALVVDDDPMVLSGLTMLLESWHYDVVAAADAASVADWLDRGGTVPTVMIADFHLGDDRTGIDVIEAVRRRFGLRIPGIILTGEHADQYRTDAGRHGLAVVQKPVTPSHLARSLEHMLAAAE